MKLGTTTHELARSEDPRVFMVTSHCEHCGETVEQRAPGLLPARLVAERFARQHEHAEQLPG